MIKYIIHAILIGVILFSNSILFKGIGIGGLYLANWIQGYEKKSKFGRRFK